MVGGCFAPLLSGQTHAKAPDWFSNQAGDLSWLCLWDGVLLFNHIFTFKFPQDRRKFPPPLRGGTS